MDIVIEQIASSEDLTAMLEVWKQVFEYEMGITLASDAATTTAHTVAHLLARLGRSGQAVGTLGVFDTSSEHQLHESLGLKFDRQSRVARFMHLAVLKPYRGMNIPLAMTLEAHRSIIVPRQFDYTWLLFDVEKATRSFLSRQLGFKSLPQRFVSEYGCRCPLVREEHTPESELFIQQAERYLKQCESVYALTGLPRANASLSLMS
jgi:hypothetical protein